MGAGQWPALGGDLRAGTTTASETQSRRVLYWRDPDSKPAFSASAAKTEDGRSFVAVYDDQEPLLPGDKPPEKATKSSEKRILYYRNPMGLPDTSSVPKKDWMGMDYIPVYEGEVEDGSTVRVNLDRVQRSGVRTESAKLRSIVRPVRAPGVAKPDERTLRTITLRADGFIDALYANETGLHVKTGDPLFRVYSPQMVSAQVDYRTAVTNAGQGPRSEPGALQRLRNLDVPESIIEGLRASTNPTMSIDWPSPVTGVVMKKDVVVGQMVRSGQEMFRLTDLSTIWVIADVAEQDIGLVKIGAPAKVSFRAFPDQTFEGRVTFVLHELEMATRTAKVRIEVANPDHRIKHEMFADVEINAGASDGERLAVPVSAVIDSGNRQVVIVERGEGLFEPRPVKQGLRGEGFVEIREGLKVGEKVVVAANFLIDAESNLKAALKGFTQDGANAAEAKP
ncbi:MAG: efflux RND transporter periplasmic adaptor subunit [Sphingomonadales bacterium]|nr:efflux RND transporter periplasmic adaptor subunit [Sphingomonadales bacterium]